MVDEHANRTLEHFYIARRQCQVAGGAAIFFELIQDPAQLNDEPIDSA